MKYIVSSLLICSLLAFLAANAQSITSNINVELFSGSNSYWLAIAVKNANVVTTSVQVKDSSISSTWHSMQINADWGYWTITNPAGVQFVFPISVSLISANGNQITVSIASLTSGAVDTGAQYGSSQAVATTAPSKTVSTSAPNSAPKDTAASNTVKPVSATSAPATVEPVAATSKPVAATTKPIAATVKPVVATAKPVAATSAPTVAPAIIAPTVVPATSSGRKCPVGTWWQPLPSTTWQWQLTGTIDTSVNVQMYDIDLYDATTEVISKLHSQGKVVVCYFSTQYEDWRPDASAFTSPVLGNNLDDWAGEKWVDIRSPVVRNILATRLDLAVSKGCDGVEPDNVDGYTVTTGFPVTAADQLDFNQFIASAAHARGLSVGLKNDVDQLASLQPYFDWALNEQCNQYKECTGYSVFTKNNKAVFNTEYSGTGANVCPAMVTAKISSLIKKLDLDASITAECCTYATGGCAEVGYRCVSA